MTYSTPTIFVPFHEVDDIIRRGTRAVQPVASDMTPGTLYCVTDEGNKVERSNGAVWESFVGTTGGGVSAHAPTHSNGGTDPVTVTALAGYPGGTTTFLRADGTFGTPATGVPGAHHVTHEPGGVDAMAVDAVAATGSLRTLGAGSQQAAPGNDARLTNARTPTAHHATHEPGGADALANAAWTNVANVFTPDQTFGRDVIVGRDLYEKARPLPIGHWVDQAFNAANFSALGPMTLTVTAGQVAINRYCLIGKTMLWTLYIVGASLGGTASNMVLLNIPGGASVPAINTGGGATMQLYDTRHRSGYVTPVNGVQVKVQSNDEGAYVLNSGATYIRFLVALEIL